VHKHLRKVVTIKIKEAFYKKTNQRTAMVIIAVLALAAVLIAYSDGNGAHPHMRLLKKEESTNYPN
jgi:transposase